MVKEARESSGTRRARARSSKSSRNIRRAGCSTSIEATGQKQAAGAPTRTQAGASCCIGDIGTHAENLGRYITGLKIESLCAEFTTFIPGPRARRRRQHARPLPRRRARACSMPRRFPAARKTISTSASTAQKARSRGSRNIPNELIFQPKDKPARILRRGNGYVSDVAKKFTRLPFGASRGLHRGVREHLSRSRRAIRDRDRRQGGSAAI